MGLLCCCICWTAILTRADCACVQYVAAAAIEFVPVNSMGCRLRMQLHFIPLVLLALGRTRPAKRSHRARVQLQRIPAEQTRTPHTQHTLTRSQRALGKPRLRPTQLAGFSALRRLDLRMAHRIAGSDLNHPLWRLLQTRASVSSSAGRAQLSPRLAHWQSGVSRTITSE